MDVRYTKWHNNYYLELGQIYKASFYKKGWLLVQIDDTNQALLREECFEQVK